MVRRFKLGTFAAILGLVLVAGMLPLQLNAQSMPMAMAKLPLTAPTWYHGDTWTWKGPMGGAVAMTVESAATDGSYTIAGMGAGVRPNMEWGAMFKREQIGNFLFLKWPLTANKRWIDKGTKADFVWRVGPVQSVTVPAGTFSAVELLCSVLTMPSGNPPAQQQVGTGFAWYSPAAKTIVKITFGPEAAWPADVRNKSVTLTKYTIH